MTALLTIIFVLTILYGIFATAGNKLFPQIGMSSPKKSIGFLFLAIGIIGLAINSIIVKVGAQQTGVVITPTGVTNTPIKTGWHFVPWWNSVEMMDKTVWTYTFAQSIKEGQKESSDAIWAPTKDGIKLGYDMTVTWKIDENQAPWIYSNISEEDGNAEARYRWIEENIIRSYSKSALSAVTKEYSTIEAYSSKRDEIQDKTFNKLKLESYSNAKIIIVAVNIREVHYNAEFEKAINAKKLAEQEALRLVDVTRQKEELLKQASINKDIAIQQAEGEAKALQIKGNAVASNPKIVDLEWINKWNGELPIYLMGNGQGVIMNMPQK